MTDKEYDKLKPGDTVMELRTSKKWKFVKEYVEMLELVEHQLKGVDSLYNNAVGRCEKYAIIENPNEISRYNRRQIPLYNFINDFKIKISMENEIKIKVPEGKKAVQNVDSNGNIVIKFEDTETIRSKSWEEFCKNHSVVENEWYISNISRIYDTYTGHNNRDVVDDTNLLETKEDAEGILALIQLTRLHDEWVGDWKANWECCESKFVILHTANEYIIRDGVYYHRLLVFPTREMAEEFMECFKDLLEKAKRFI